MFCRPGTGPYGARSADELSGVYAALLRVPDYTKNTATNLYNEEENMKLGTKINLPGIRGVSGLEHTLSTPSAQRRVKVYLVPESVSSDRYYISVTPVGAIEVLPPSRSKHTLLLADFSQDGAGRVTINHVNKEVTDA
jgi:hypothetical protein